MGTYCLKVGGLAWPFNDKPGVAVVLGKTWEEDPTLHARKIRVLAIRSAENLNVLSRYYHELQEQYGIDDWLGNPSEGGRVEYLWDLAQKAKKSFYLEPARNCDDPKNLGVYLSMIELISNRQQKILEYGEHGSFFASYLDGLSFEDRSKPAEEHPPIAALAYALSELQGYEPEDEDDQEPQPPHMGRNSVTGY